LKDWEEQARTYTAADLFRFPVLRAKTSILLCCWVTCASLYYVLLLDQSELSEDLYLGFLVTAAVQLPGYVYVILTLERPVFGRKRSMCLFLLVSGACLTAHPLLPAHMAAPRVALSVLGRFAANCSYTILNLYSAELFPTVVRGVGMGFTVVVSRLGTILAPYVLLLGHHAPVFFGVSALLSGVLALLLPETLAFARKLAANSSPTAVSVIKQQAYLLPHKSLDEAQAINDRIQASCLMDVNPDHKEGFAAFTDKRPPRFNLYDQGLPYAKLARDLLSVDLKARL